MSYMVTFDKISSTASIEETSTLSSYISSLTSEISKKMLRFQLYCHHRVCGMDVVSEIHKL